MFEHIVIVIPSLEPTVKLIEYVDKLITRGFQDIIVVDDGSGENYGEIFNSIKEKSQCVVLRHEVNQGKGRALKTGFQYIQENIKHCNGIVTVDSDGQHLVEDVNALASQLLKIDNELILGSRNLNLPNIPRKSKVGNHLTSILFFCLYNKWLPDTQTGLRGFSGKLLEYMIGVQGERFEYEMQVIIDCVSDKIPISQVKIKTIYDDNNKGTHFRPIQDSARVMQAVFGKFSKYLTVSLLSTLIDIGIAWFLLDYLKGFIQYGFIRVSAAVGFARVVSMICNYFMNRIFVFNIHKMNLKAWVKYVLLCCINILISSIFVFEAYVLLGVSEKVGKVIISSILFFVNYQVQRLWVFKIKHWGE